MSLMRSLLLAGSESRWLREQATRRRFVRRAVRRFMPGERLEDAMAAAAALRAEGFGTVLTHLGENIADMPEAEAEVRHYGEVLRKVREAGLDAEVSVKLTHLGLDLDAGRTAANLEAIAESARRAGAGTVWIDMEGTAYTDATIDVYRRARAGCENVGLCLQAYLRRTRADLEALLPLAPRIRLVKGAYREPPHLAFPRKGDVDASFFDLTARLFEAGPLGAGARLVVGTHDTRLISRIEALVLERKVPKEAFEFTLLYGIQRAEQARLVRAGFRTRILISYGASWFPWYMRRLAERPANVLFVARSLFS